MLIEPEEIAAEAVSFFKTLLSSEGGNFRNDFIFDIPSLVSSEDNKMLMSPFSLEEVRMAVFTMSPDKAPGLDGLTPLFFQKCWDFVGKDPLLALEESRRNRSILKEINTTTVAIIPKEEVVKSFADFHPIALCNTLYKIFSKAISIRLSKILPKLISVEQGGFVPNREMPEGAIVAHEVLHSISLQKSPAMILKLDMIKAYDRV